jgi:hypothetical protein
MQASRRATEGLWGLRHGDNRRAVFGVLTVLGIRLVVVSWLCAAGLLCWSGAASAGGLSSPSGSGVSPLEDPLVVPESQALLGGQSVLEAEEARRASPEAVVARQESQTKFEGMSAGEAAVLASEVFPGVVDESAGGPPRLPAGESIPGFPAVNAAEVDLGGGKHGVIESTEPMAVEASPGLRVPVDLGLNDVGNAFEPAQPVVGVRIPKRLGEGVRLADSDVSLTPVDSSGGALNGSEGAIDGATVLYANTQADADTVIKPTTSGFDASTVLRSVNSPQQLFFRVGMPVGASWSSPGSVDTGDYTAIAFV